jgi:hypothetical protein
MHRTKHVGLARNGGMASIPASESSKDSDRCFRHVGGSHLSPSRQLTSPFFIGLNRYVSDRLGGHPFSADARSPSPYRIPHPFNRTKRHDRNGWAVGVQGDGEKEC